MQGIATFLLVLLVAVAVTAKPAIEEDEGLLPGVSYRFF